MQDLMVVGFIVDEKLTQHLSIVKGVLEIDL